MMLTNTVIPSPIPYSANALETYNSVLSVHQLVENTDLTVCYDNLALKNVYLKRLNQKSFTLDDQNSLISRCMLNQTSCMRLPRQQEIDLRKMAVNLVPFPRLHFFLPFLSFSSNKGLIDAFTDTPTNNLASVDYRHGRFLSLANIFRGKDLSLEEILNQTLNLKNKNSDYFVEWIPNNYVIGVCQEPEKNIEVSSTFISNSSAIIEAFHRLSENFTAMFRKKAFLHHYTGEGMDEMEFPEAESNMNDLVSEYQQYQDATANEEGEEGEEDVEQA
jgi:tubulin beta